MTRLAALLAVFCLPLSALAADAPVAADQPLPAVHAGRDYAVLVPAQPTSAGPDKIEVIEFFWYGCPHCFAFEPFVEKWLESKPDNVVFRRVPAVINPAWKLLARAWYVAKALGVTDTMHKALFDAIHVDHRQITSVTELEQFFVDHGVSKEQFDNTYHSFEVDNQMRRATELAQRYQVTAVPTMIVNGKYRTDGSFVRTYDGLMKITEALVAKEEKAVGH
ncbi:MAG: thiol:disulfide interchange protein DsbA/DsbL [Gammaproteobacteria bacterium]|jgi:thiol:disulfide interchange protein DsbA